ncbi:MAG TPA: tetratricopeptide repeat protein, partial [Thermomicrobiaceae bacterium]|nr:tetratricopeptide repeat protein [Thermomicrobiaceae bacterium]
RAVAAAAELRLLPDELSFISALRLAITAGTMRSGPYGGATRRTYGAVGDAVNLAARLMQQAAPWQILATQAIARSTTSAFAWQNLPPVRVAGKRSPVAVAAFAGPRPRQGIHLPEQSSVLPLIGRSDELDLVRSKIDEALAGQGQIVGITGEPGCGKSRFLGEVMRLGHDYGFTVYGCGCESYGTNHSYLVWQSIWQAFFGLDPSLTLDEQILALREQLGAIDPGLISRLPLLGAVLGLRIPDNELTRTFDARLRKTSLEALLVDCIRARAATMPLLLVLEDCHWIDPVSHDLLEAVGRAIADRPVLLALAYRPPEPPRLPAPRVSELPYFTGLRLDDLMPAEARRLIQLKMQQIAGADVVVTPELARRIEARAQGNPFFIEELLNYLRDQGIGQTDLAAIEQLDLPTSLQRLVLSRVDRLSENEQVTLKAASIVGRSFPFRWLWGVYPDLGDDEEVHASVVALMGRELTVPEEPDPNPSYAFKHPVTHEVSYASLLSTTRAMLHRRLGSFLEQQDPKSLSQRLDLLAFHFDRGDDPAKKREYLRRAGEAAQAAYANESAIDYYQRVLPLVDGLERVEVTLRLGQVLDVVGKWTEAGECYQQALGLAEQFGDRVVQARCRFAIGGLRRRQGHHDEALDWLRQALVDFEQADDRAGASQTLTEIGIVYRLRGDFADARAYYDRGLKLIEAGGTDAGSSAGWLERRATTLKEAGTLATQQGDLELARDLYLDSLATLRDAGDKTGVANLLNNLGILARWQGDYEGAHASHSEALAIRRQLGDRWAISYSLTNLGNVAHNLGDLTSAQALHEESLMIQRQLGATQDIARSLHNLANVARDQRRFDQARSLYAEAVSSYHELGDRWSLAYLFEDLAILMGMQSQPELAARLVGAGAAVRQSMNTPLSEADSAQLWSRLSPFRSALGDEVWEQYSGEGMNMSLEQATLMVLP